MFRRLVCAAIALGLIGSASGPATASEPGEAPSRKVSPFDSRQDGNLTMREIVRRAKPVAAPRMPARVSAGTGGKPVDPAATPFRVPGRAAPGSSPLIGEIGFTSRQRRDPYWSGAPRKSPNRQVGLMVMKGPVSGTCSATVVAGARKYAVLVTAGHCLYNPPSNRWADSVRFCPGYRGRCRMGWWRARWMTLSSTWYSGVTLKGRRVNRWADDFAIVTLRPNRRGPIGRVTGYQGIYFNGNYNDHRLSLGYPAPSNRSRYYYDGKRLAFCTGYNAIRSGIMSIPCTMTGGSSGGPWLTDWNRSYVGYVESVNSSGPNTRMKAPYFDDEEQQIWREGSRR